MQTKTEPLCSALQPPLPLAGRGRGRGFSLTRRISRHTSAAAQHIFTCALLAGAGTGSVRRVLLCAACRSASPPFSTQAHCRHERTDFSPAPTPPPSPLAGGGYHAAAGGCSGCVAMEPQPGQRPHGESALCHGGSRRSGANRHGRRLAQGARLRGCGHPGVGPHPEDSRRDWRQGEEGRSHRRDRPHRLCQHGEQGPREPRQPARAAGTAPGRAGAGR